MQIEFKGIVRGAYSKCQPDAEKDGWASDNPGVYRFVGDSLHEILNGLAIEEWIFILKVNGKRIKDPLEYIKRKGLNPADYMREEVAA